jgi:hypothetical protein
MARLRQKGATTFLGLNRDRKIDDLGTMHHSLGIHRKTLGTYTSAEISSGALGWSLCAQFALP